MTALKAVLVTIALAILLPVIFIAGAAFVLGALATIVYVASSLIGLAALAFIVLASLYGVFHLFDI